MQKKLAALFLLSLSTQAFTSNRNPASIDYVNSAISAAIAAAVPSYKVGQLVQGGIVFFVDQSGQHGLVAKLTDLSDTYPWTTDSSGNVYAGGDGVYGGFTNTALIIAENETANFDYAAYRVSLLRTSYSGQACAPGDNSSLCYAGWYLPSVNEFAQMASALCNVSTSDFIPLGNNVSYWTSVADNSTNPQTLAWAATITSSGEICTASSATDAILSEKQVRAIRAF